MFIFFLMIRRPPRSTLDRSSAASDVYKRQIVEGRVKQVQHEQGGTVAAVHVAEGQRVVAGEILSLIHISEPTRPY